MWIYLATNVQFNVVHELNNFQEPIKLGSQETLINLIIHVTPYPSRDWHGFCWSKDYLLIILLISCLLSHPRLHYFFRHCQRIQFNFIDFPPVRLPVQMIFAIFSTNFFDCSIFLVLNLAIPSHWERLLMLSFATWRWIKRLQHQ